jgi:hypothetical protein
MMQKVANEYFPSRGPVFEALRRVVIITWFQAHDHRSSLPTLYNTIIASSQRQMNCHTFNFNYLALHLAQPTHTV